MPVLNPDFVLRGSGPGSALHWRLTTRVQAERLAGFGPAPEAAVESFERWSEWLGEFRDGTLVLAMFFARRPRAFENFADGWLDRAPVFSLDEVVVEVARFGLAAHESMEQGWTGEPFVTAWEQVTPEFAEFDGSRVETFVWSAPPQSLWVPARFGTAVVEAFDTAWPTGGGSL